MIREKKSKAIVEEKQKEQEWQESQTRWHMPVILAPRKLRQKD
jgi:hypothetical protein